MKTKEFAELEAESRKFIEVLENATARLRVMRSDRAAAALSRLTDRIDLDMAEVIREMRLLEAQGA